MSFPFKQNVKEFSRVEIIFNMKINISKKNKFYLDLYFNIVKT